MTSKGLGQLVALKGLKHLQVDTWLMTDALRAQLTAGLPLLETLNDERVER